MSIKYNYKCKYKYKYQCGIVDGSMFYIKLDCSLFCCLILYYLFCGLSRVVLKGQDACPKGLALKSV